jgi:tyrosyl-tRNA synthetase
MHDLLGELTARGFVQDATPGLAERLKAGPLTAYVGFDPTADSLHVGNLVPVMGLAWLQRAGGTPIALIGGGTGMVGDPSGKRTERPLLSLEQIDANAAAVRNQLASFLSFEGANAARLRDNAEWLRTLPLMEFLRDTGKHFTLSYMLQKESVKSRLESGISFTEFSYMLVQAYDFWHLFKREACELQMGGSDQWGNITAGTELIGRREGKQAHGLVFPLLTTSAGAKFGKSESGNIWLDPARTSPYQFYQFWLNTDDRDVERCLKLFTFLPVDEIAGLMREQVADPGRRPAQRALAADVTARVHGTGAVPRIIAASQVLFGGGDIASADPAVFEVLKSEVPTVQAAVRNGSARLIGLLVESGLATSKSDAARGLAGKGYSLNGAAQTEDRLIEAKDLLGGRFVLLQKGKKRYALVEASD